MGAYRFAIYLEWQIALGIKYTEGFIVLDLPFISLLFNLTKNARGNNLTNN